MKQTREILTLVNQRLPNPQLLGKCPSSLLSPLLPSLTPHPALPAHHYHLARLSNLKPFCHGFWRDNLLSLSILVALCCWSVSAPYLEQKLSNQHCGGGGGRDVAWCPAAALMVSNSLQGDLCSASPEISHTVTRKSCITTTLQCFPSLILDKFSCVLTYCLRIY